MTKQTSSISRLGKTRLIHGLPIFIYATALALGMIAFVNNPERSVSFHYERAAERWVGGESLYEHSKDSGHGFLYLPQAAILHTPYAFASAISGWPLFGDLLWRLFSWSMLAWATMRLSSVIFSDWRDSCGVSASTNRIDWRIALATSMLGLSCLRIGQSTLLMTAIMLLCLDCWYRERYPLCAALAVLAICVKPLAIVLPMLLFVVTPKTRKPLLFGGILALAAPFVLQSPTYVWQQYVDCVAMLRTASNAEVIAYWAQPFSMLSQFGIDIPSQFLHPIRAAAALVVLVIVMAATRNLSRSRQVLWLFAWTGIYLMLFNPRTENSTYALIGPLYGWYIAKAELESRRIAGWFAFGLLILTMGSHEIGKHFTPADGSANWLAPLCCCVLTAMLAIEFLSEMKQTQQDADDLPSCSR
ncbi:hypothetical protein Q31b_22670 [Novipirellula aureliae]|uniref:DUF2029 domain-containing protein n=1 Tax=Novipirellula aureliae TaxID=2527966 RepID=A0A5C6E7P1_9BACT|nr:glycosyltransferase 87 family protein [Novipirellula aureliae]TWU43229.1 hypothetical protein Q31b_22670 [Novipirellula aureliae]